MIGFILFAAMLPQIQAYDANELTHQVIQKIEQQSTQMGSQEIKPTPLGMIRPDDQEEYQEGTDSEAEGLFPVRRPRRPAPSPKQPPQFDFPDICPEAPADTYTFPILGRIFWGFLRLPIIQFILKTAVVVAAVFITLLFGVGTLKSYYGTAWMAGLVEDIIVQTVGLFTGIFAGISNAFKGNKDDKVTEDDASDANDSE